MNVAIAAGGTGGHVIPALALARGLRADGIDPVFVTDRRGVAFGDELQGVARHAVRAGGIAGRSLFGRIGGAVSLAVGFVQSRRLLRRFAPAVVVGFGGYASLPPAAAAASLRIPVLVHESNAILGRANRLLARRAAVVATGFAGDLGAAADCVHTGVPVRDAFLSARARGYAAPGADGRVRILAVGGSQGATSLGRTVPRALASLPQGLRRRLRVEQQCRAEDLESARTAYTEAGIEAHLAPFIDDVARRLADAHLVIARAGASTVAEIAAVGRPAILVPYPFAADDHQTANARAVARAGGGWLVAEGELDAPGLARRVAALLEDDAALERAAAGARALGRPDCVARLVALIRRLAGEARS